MSNRIRLDWEAINDFLKTPEMQSEIKRHTRRIDQNATQQGSQSRVDFSASGERARGAVIAGYEDGATAENTRRVLLRSLEGGTDG